MSDLRFRVISRLPVRAKRRFYDNTFLRADDGSTVLFIADAAVVEGTRGVSVRVKRDVLEFPTEREMLAAVVAGDWREAPLDGNPQWRPTERQVSK